MIRVTLDNKFFGKRFHVDMNKMVLKDRVRKHHSPTATGRRKVVQKQKNLGKWPKIWTLAEVENFL